ncbi:MAG TPA: hypothetical protein VNC82_17625 [Candidatus Limnocylindria bacterium]|nr:hypothetical protein [Candidatus Limnocylindria bacterium]
MAEGHRAVSVLYQALLTGLVLSLVTRRSEEEAAEFVFQLFRRQHLEKFLPGLAKLGLGRLPPAVACAQYHFLSNQMGGVKTEYAYESDRKAWVRYPPPRWIWDGAAICGIPSRVNAAILHGWHGHNGVSLGNPRLGFVCTGQTVDGHPGLEGYYLEHDRELAEDEHVRFASEEAMPEADPANAPRLDAKAWPAERLDTVVARYAMEYVRTALPVLLELLGPADTRSVLGRAARLIGMQLFEETARLLGIADSGPAAFARYLAALAAAQGEQVEVTTEPGRARVLQKGWRLARGLEPLDPAAFDAWAELWHGALAAHDRRLRLAVTRAAGAVDFAITSR